MHSTGIGARPTFRANAHTNGGGGGGGGGEKEEEDEEEKDEEEEDIQRWSSACSHQTPCQADSDTRRMHLRSCWASQSHSEKS
jgi:hypothetical protein